MLFNSLPFLLAFLPTAVVFFFVLGRPSPALAGLWLVAVSLFFYGWWNPAFVGLLLGSVILNYAGGCLIGRSIRSKATEQGRGLLAIVIALDLLLLAFFKYAAFFVQSADDLLGVALSVPHVVLPLGISFFTFTQIAFLVDVYQGKASDFNFLRYLLFVTYFPHLIAGPILHHAQMMPQFAERRTYRINWTHMATGLTVLIIGLSKKVLIADNFGAIATPIFSATQHGSAPALVTAWAGALAYTLQLYFDFSGYSDMAIGLSLFFNVRLPLNFNSPYKAENIIDFWRRWHMTLSAFLRAYLYIPLGGNRKGRGRRYLNLFITMLLGGLWHGAGWTFVVWGGLHGVYLMINHAFRALRERVGWPDGRFGRIGALVAGSLTFGCVVVAWVFFRADSFATAGVMLQGMSGAAGLRHDGIFLKTGLDWGTSLSMIGAGLAAVWLLPNTQEFMRDFHPAYEDVAPPRGLGARLAWKPVRWWTWSSAAALLTLSILSAMEPTRVSEFLYYQF